MIRKRNLTALLVVLSLFGAVLSTANQCWAQAFAPHADPAGGYTIMYPAHWERRIVHGITVSLSPRESPADTFQENVNVTYEQLPMPLTPAQYATASIANLQRQLAGFALLEQGPITVGNIPAQYMIFRHFSGQNLMVMTLYLVRGNRGYTITCTATPTTLARYRASFLQIANTIRFH
jgi:hypothetical protein